MLINPYVFGSLWTPSYITTALWLDAADSSTITAISGAVSQWNDKSGNGKHVSQSTAANRPTLSAASFNGKDAVLFDGSNDFLQSSLSITSGTYTGNMCVYWVASRTGVNGALLTERLTTLVKSFSWSVVSNVSYISSDGANISSNMSIADATLNKLASSGGLVAHFHLPSQRDILYLNGTQETVNAGTASNITGSATGFRIGCREGAVGAFWNGRICEVVVMLTSQSIADRQRMEGYLAWKWGLTANLPANHPYKSAAPTV